MFFDEEPALVRRDAAEIVNNHLRLIRNLTWDFLKKQEYERFSLRELMGVSYEAARQAWETFKPELGYVFATHCRKRIKHALNDYAGDRDRTVQKMELRPKRYAAAWGDPDAVTAKPPKGGRPLLYDEYYDENGNKVRQLTAGPYRSNAQLLRGLGTVISRHGKVPFAPIRSEFKDGWQSSDGCGWKHVRVEGDGNPGVINGHHTYRAGAKEFDDKGKHPPAESSDWNRIWADNYRKYRCWPGCQSPHAGTPIVSAAQPWVGPQPKSYVRDDDAVMIAVSDKCYVNKQYFEGFEAAPAKILRLLYAVPHWRPSLSDFLSGLRYKYFGYDFIDPPNPIFYVPHKAKQNDLEGWTPGNRRWRMKDPLPDRSLPLTLLLPKARIAYDKGRAARKRTVELAGQNGEDAGRLRKRERRVVAEVDAPWQLPSPEQLFEKRAERPTWLADDEIKKHADRWVMVRTGNIVSLIGSKNSILGRYNSVGKIGTDGSSAGSACVGVLAGYQTTDAPPLFQTNAPVCA